jgi:triosephosphate isomerase
MNKTVEQARLLVAEMLPGLQAEPSVERVLCPPFPALMALAAQLTGTGIGLGAQNMYWEASGAYTGEIAPAMVKEFCEYVILGHSERRTYFGETDVTVNRKVKAALANQLIPIVCIGETLAENEAGQTSEVVIRQVLEGLKELTEEQARKIVIAYEPVWAIGTGKTATPEIASDAHRFIRAQALAAFGAAAAAGVRILYGGSVKPDNTKSLMAKDDIDGALVGGASLTPDSFAAIVNF